MVPGPVKMAPSWPNRNTVDNASTSRTSDSATRLCNMAKVRRTLAFEDGERPWLPQEYLYHIIIESTNG